MDDIIQKLQIETLRAQMSLLQLGRAYLEGRCSSPDAVAAETTVLMKLADESRKESRALQGEMRLLQGKIKPIWG
jgi:hypothetical protein